MMSKKRQRDERKEENSLRAKDYYSKNKAVIYNKKRERTSYIRNKLMFDAVKDRFMRCQVCDRVLMKTEQLNGICNSCKALEEIEDLKRMINEKR